jgi:hypothetical protein
MYSSFLEEGIVFDQSVSGKAITAIVREKYAAPPQTENKERVKRIAIYALVVGLIFPGWTAPRIRSRATPAIGDSHPRLHWRPFRIGRRER